MIREHVYTLEETAKLMGVNRSTVYRWLEAGKLPGENIGGVVLIPRWAVEMLKAERQATLLARGRCLDKGASVISGIFYTIGEAADQLGKNRHTVARWISSGKLPATPFGNVVLICKEDLDRLTTESHLEDEEPST